jgi:hypothetical protein
MSKTPKYYDENRSIGDRVRRNYSIANFAWDDGHSFALVPRQSKQTGECHVELRAYEDDQADVELSLTFDLASLKSLRTELDSVIAWIESGGDYAVPAERP